MAESDLPISGMTQGTINTGSIIPGINPDPNSQSGYSNYAFTADQMASAFLNFLFPLALDTTNKSVFGAINELAAAAGTEVIANPGTPTDTLKTIGINGTNYDINAAEALKLVATRHTTDTAPYLFRQSGGDNNAYVGTSETDKLVGASAVVNQTFNYDGGMGKNNGTIEVSNNSLTFTTTYKSTYQYINQSQVFLAGHKVLVSLDVTLSENETVGFGYGGGIVHLTICTANTKKHIEYIDNFANSAKDIYVYLARTAGLSVGATAIIDNFIITDLTAMFGTAIADYVYSLEQATEDSGIAYLRKYGFFTKDYYPYAANTLQSVKTSAHVMTGANLFNVLDYEGFVAAQSGITNTRTETGYITTNSASANRTVNLDLGVLRQGNYYISFTSKKSDNTDLTIFLVKNGTTQGSSTTGFTLSSNGSDTFALRTFVVANDSNTVSNIQLQLGSTATAYEPYVKHEYALPNIDLRGLYKLDASNNLYADGDTLEGDGTLTRKYEQRPYQSGDESLADAITDGTNTVVKLATPTTEQATGFTNPQTVSKDGTEEYTDERDFPLPVGHETDYPKGYEMALPPPPEETGVYNLQVNVSSAGKTYGWAAESDNRSVSLSKSAAPEETKTETEPDPEKETKEETKEAPIRSMELRTNSLDTTEEEKINKSEDNEK